MSRIYLVRHGRAAADWGSHVDPGLDDVGRTQAEAMASELAPKGPLPLVASPLRRTRETAAAREAVVEALRALSEDTIVVSHYIAINVAVGHALGDARVTCFRPDYCSCTLLDVADGRLVLIELGAQGATRVL